MKNGFTLIELLAVIIILAIIMVIAVPQVLSVIETTRQNANELNLKIIKRAAETYVESGKKEFEGTSMVIRLTELVSEGFIGQVLDPKNKKTECEGYIKVTIEDGDATYLPSLKCGDDFKTDGYDHSLAIEPPVYANANIHEISVPSGYIGIYTIEDLNNVRNNLTGSYILMNNLDFNSDSSYANPTNKTAYTTGTGWNPIGTSSSTFKGIFNGNGYVIKNLFINRPSVNYVGLFGVSYRNTIIEKLGLENVNITAASYVGALIGDYELFDYALTIKNVYTTGTITATGDKIGGIIGNLDKGTIENSYSTVNITGGNDVAGIVGRINPGTVNINNCFAAGNVICTAASCTYGRINTYYGGTNGYYNINATFTGTGGYTISANPIEPPLIYKNIFINNVLGWDIQNIWYVSENNYPILGGTTNRTIYVPVTSITKIEELFSVRRNLAGNYTLANDLDFNNDNSYYDSDLKTLFTTGTGWLPIGNSNFRFTGSFNGNGHKISNMYINKDTQTHIGLFGYINSSNSIQGIGIEDANVTGNMHVGALTGYKSSTGIISNCYSKNGNITAKTAYVGGLIGYHSAGTTTNSYSTGTVSNNGGYAGGFIAYLSNGTLDKNYSIANVSGVSTIGGFIGGGMNGTVSNCFSAGNVTSTGTGYGRFSGDNTYATFTNDYYNSASSLTGVSSEIVKGTGTTTTNLQALNQTGLTIWDTSTIWKVNAGAYPTLR